jgi:DNA-binding MarR family transcriptional regulator/GNAT superfamily N-acetyltransferase
MGGTAPAAAQAPADDRDPVARVRRFSRFYTQRLGLLDRELLASGFTLTQSRVLWELAHRAPLTASQLRADLGVDAGYLSRLLGGLREQGLLEARRAPEDARMQRLSLTAKGRRAYARLDAASRTQVTQWLSRLPPAGQDRLVGALDAVHALLDEPGAGGPGTDEAATAEPAAGAAVTLDEPGPGDLGWVVQRHGALYAAEYGWDWRFEALVARIGADFIERFQPGLERGWIARRAGVNLGCVFLMQAPPAEYGEGTAKLRLLLVEPSARGLGLGRRLAQACEDFARQAGYRRITLWTNSVLHAARAIYVGQGYRLVKEEPHHSFGHDLLGQTWELALDGPPPARARGTEPAA